MKNLFNRIVGPMIAAGLVGLASSAGSLSPRAVLAYPGTQRVLLALALVVACLVGLLPAEVAAVGVLIGNVQPFPSHPEYTGVAIAYRNGKLIADSVMPYVPVTTQTFKYLVHNKADGFTVPDLKVGRKSAPNQVEFGATDASASVHDYGLDCPVPQDDIDAARAIPGYDPLAKGTMQTMDLVLLGREIRVANKTFNAANYAVGNKDTLAGSTQWSHADSNPVSAMLTAMDSMIMRPNTLVLGRAVATKLQQHPKVLKAWHGNDGDQGVVPLPYLAKLLEIDNIYVGEGWVNTAKKGQAASMSRVWGKHAALLHINPLADTMFGTTWGYTARFGNRFVNATFDKDIGLKGGQMLRVGEQVEEVVTASDLGYLFIDAVA